MEETGTPAPKGPWLQAACLCEQAIIATDGSISLIRLFDHLQVSQLDATGKEVALSAGPAGEHPAIVRSFKIVIVLKGGDAPGDVLIELDVVRPNGTTLSGFQQLATLGVDEKGTNIVIDAMIGFDQVGLF
jgi:hypothetical protein